MLFDWLSQTAAALCGAAVDHSSLLAALFSAGLLGGATHCGAMCGPFVVAQVGRRLDRRGEGELRGLARLRGAALVPYHLGRTSTYVALGTTAGAFTDALTAATNLRWLPTAMLFVAAALFLLQAYYKLVPAKALGSRRPILTPLARSLSRIAAPLMGAARGPNGYALGVTLGFLPCGLLYSALVAAGGSGSVLSGALSMTAFALGTVPGLVAVGWGTALADSRLRGVFRLAAGPLAAVNGALLFAVAVRSLV